MKPNIGDKFERLTVLGEPFYLYDERYSRNVSHVECKCECGEVVQVAVNSLKRGLVKSCGCLRRELAKKRYRTYDGRPIVHKDRGTEKTVLFQGKEWSIRDLATLAHMNYKTMWYRISNGWEIDVAISTPVRSSHN